MKGGDDHPYKVWAAFSALADIGSFDPLTQRFDRPADDENAGIILRLRRLSTAEPDRQVR